MKRRVAAGVDPQRLAGRLPERALFRRHRDPAARDLRLSARARVSVGLACSGRRERGASLGAGPAAGDLRARAALAQHRARLPVGGQRAAQDLGIDLHQHERETLRRGRAGLRAAAHLVHRRVGQPPELRGAAQRAADSDLLRRSHVPEVEPLRPHAAQAVPGNIPTTVEERANRWSAVKTPGPGAPRAARRPDPGPAARPTSAGHACGDFFSLCPGSGK